MIYEFFKLSYTKKKVKDPFDNSPSCAFSWEILVVLPAVAAGCLLPRSILTRELLAMLLLRCRHHNRHHCANVSV